MRILRGAVASVFFLVCVITTHARNLSIGTLGPSSTPEDSVVIADRAGNLLPPGSGIVTGGSFPTLTDAKIRELATWSVARLLNEFHQFGNAGTVSEFAGIVSHDASMPAADGDDFVGNPVYTVIGNSDALETSTEFLIHRAPFSFIPDSPLHGEQVRLGEATDDQMIVGLLGDPVQQDDFGVPVRSIRLQATRAGRTFQITNLQQAENRHITLTWTSRDRATYRLERSEDLNDWLELTDGIPSEGVETSFTDKTVEPDAKLHYYRVSQEQ